MDEQAMQQIVQALISIGVPQENAMQIAQSLGQAQDENHMMQILQQAGLNEQQIQQLGAQLQGGQPQGQRQQQAVPQQPMPPQGGGMPQEMPMQGQDPMMAQQGQMATEMTGAPQQYMMGGQLGDEEGGLSALGMPLKFAYGGRYYKKPVNLMQEELRQKPFIVIEPGNFEGKTRYRKGGLKKNVATYKTGGDFPPSMMNNDVNGGDRMAMDYMDRQRSPQPQTQQQANNEARAAQSNEAPFVASDGSTWQYNGSEYVKIADADFSKAYDPTAYASDSYETPTQSKTIEEDGAATKRYNDYTKSTYKDDTNIYGSDIEGKTELYESRNAKGVSMDKPVEFMPKYAYDSLPDSMKKEADKKLEKGMLKISEKEGSDYASKGRISYSDEGMDVSKKRGTRELDIDYVAPVSKPQEVKPVKLSAKQQKAKEEQPKISTPAARVEYKRPDVSYSPNKLKYSKDTTRPGVSYSPNKLKYSKDTTENIEEISSSPIDNNTYKPSENTKSEMMLFNIAKEKGVKLKLDSGKYINRDITIYEVDGMVFYDPKEAYVYIKNMKQNVETPKRNTIDEPNIRRFKL